MASLCNSYFHNTIRIFKVMIERLAKDKDSLEQTIQDLSDNIKELEAQSDRAKENERLLIMYPDLNGPVNPDISGMYASYCTFLHIL